jgi:hypothetical protein
MCGVDYYKLDVQGGQNVYVQLMVTIHSVISNEVSPASLQTVIDTKLTLTPSVIPDSKYVIMVSD